MHPYVLERAKQYASEVLADSSPLDKALLVKAFTEGYRMGYDEGWTYGVEYNPGRASKRRPKTMVKAFTEGYRMGYDEGWTYGVEYNIPATGDLLYVYSITGKQDRVAMGTNTEAMIYLRMLRAVYPGVTMAEIPDDGRFSFPLADVCWSAKADEALECGWVG